MTGDAGTAFGIIVTRPGAAGSALVADLVARDAPAIAAPAFTLGPPPDEAAASKALQRLADFNLVVFVSPAAVRAVAELFALPWPAHTAIATVGSATAEAVDRLLPGARGAHRIVPAGSDDDAGSEALWAAVERAGLTGLQLPRRVLLLRAQSGREWLADRFAAAGAQVDSVAVYSRAPSTPDAVAIAAMRIWRDSGLRAALVVTSSEALEVIGVRWVALPELAAGGLRAWLRDAIVLAPHARIAESARRAGYGDVRLVDAEAGAVLAALAAPLESRLPHPNAGPLTPSEPQTVAPSESRPVTGPDTASEARSEASSAASGATAAAHGEPTASSAGPGPEDRRNGARRTFEIERDARRRESRRWILAIVVLALVAAIFWLQHSLERQRGVLEMQARELTAAQVAVAEAQREVKATQQRFTDLEERIEQVRAQRAALDQLYTDISRGRDDSILIEVDRLISLAAQELQITGNVATAIAALQSADTRLARLERPQFVALRRALGRDVEKLRALPVVDATGIALRLDQLAQAVDTWPMLAQASLPLAAGKGSAAKASAGKPAAAAPPGPAASDARDAGSEVPRTGLWSRLRAWITREFGELIRIHEVSAPETLLVTEAQQSLLRQQLKLRLLEARYAALTRNERVYRADIDDVQALVAKYFDTRAPVVAAAIAQLKQAAQAPLAVEAPALSESTAALRALTGRR